MCMTRLRSTHFSFLEEVQVSGGYNSQCALMPNSTVEIRIADSSGRQQ